MARMYEMRQKEVINVKDGNRLGYVSDFEIDTESGKIKKIIIPAAGKVFGVFGREKEYHIKWGSIKSIGDDLIIIDADNDDILEDV